MLRFGRITLGDLVPSIDRVLVHGGGRDQELVVDMDLVYAGTVYGAVYRGTLYGATVGWFSSGISK